MEFDNLQGKIDKLGTQTGVFADFCEYVALTADEISLANQGQIMLSSTLRILSQEAERVDRAVLELFGNEHMLEFYHSDKCREPLTQNRQ